MEVNPFFEKEFFEKQKDHPHIKMERYVVGSAEDMKDIEDGSIDIVVSTLVLCSVPNVQAALKEIRRVLAPVCTPAINWFSCFDYFQISARAENIIIGSTSWIRSGNLSECVNISLPTRSTSGPLVAI